MQTLSNGLLSHSSWIAVGFIYTAQTGLNYRHLKKGQIDKKEFWHRMRLNSVTTVGSLAVGSGGAAAGFALGTVLFPGIGSIVGAVVGGIAGGYAGERWSAKAYNNIEQRIRESKRRRKMSKEEAIYKKLEAECRVSHDRYDEALHILGVHNLRATLSQIEECYLHMLEMIADGKAAEIKAGGEADLDEERQVKYLEKYELIMKAFEDAKEYITHYGMADSKATRSIP